MTRTIRSQSEFLQTTPLSEGQQSQTFVRREDIASSTDTTPGCVVFHLEAWSAPDVAPEEHVTVDELISKLSTRPGFAKNIRESRAAVAELMYPNEGSIRTLRLQKGMTQAELAIEIGTSQPHIARIEQGKSSIQFETMRKLARVLGVDMNSLAKALESTLSVGSD